MEISIGVLVGGVVLGLLLGGAIISLLVFAAVSAAKESSEQNVVKQPTWSHKYEHAHMRTLGTDPDAIGW